MILIVCGEQTSLQLFKKLKTLIILNELYDLTALKKIRAVIFFTRFNRKVKFNHKNNQE